MAPAATALGRQRRKRRRHLVEIGADQIGRAEHGQRILHDMPARRADARRDLAAADLGDDRRAVRLAARI